MALSGPDFYDDEKVFKTYRAGQDRPQNAKDALEKPVFDELVGSLQGQRILDLGCGDARFGREALDAGCELYFGVEGSRRMVELARATLDARVAHVTGTAQIVAADITSWEYPAANFDLVNARLVLHYIADLDSLLSKVFHTLSGGGRFICSIEHPVITSSDKAWREGEVRRDRIVDGYFVTGRRVTNWKGGTVLKYHRTVEDYFTALQRAGLVVDALRESRPQRELSLDEETYERRRRIPLMLFFRAHRSAPP